jgi:hypothetical protein
VFGVLLACAAVDAWTRCVDWLSPAACEDDDQATGRDDAHNSPPAHVDEGDEQGGNEQRS